MAGVQAPAMFHSACGESTSEWAAVASSKAIFYHAHPRASLPQTRQFSVTPEGSGGSMPKKRKPLLFTVLEAVLPDTLSMGAVATLIYLANHYNRLERYARPSQQTIAREIHATERAVRKFQLELMKEKLIKPGHGRPRHVTPWKINIPLLNSFPKRFGPRASKPEPRSALGVPADSLGNNQTGTTFRFKPEPGSADPLSDPLRRDLANYPDLDPSDRTGICEIRRKNSAARVFPENTKNQNRQLQRAIATRAPTQAGNYAVVLKLAHLTYDELGDSAALGAISEDLKGRCARKHIQYDGWLIQKALTSAQAQRRRNGAMLKHHIKLINMEGPKKPSRGFVNA